MREEGLGWPRRGTLEILPLGFIQKIAVTTIFPLLLSPLSHTLDTLPSPQSRKPIKMAFGKLFSYPVSQTPPESLHFCAFATIPSSAADRRLLSSSPTPAPRPSVPSRRPTTSTSSSLMPTPRTLPPSTSRPTSSARSPPSSARMATLCLSALPSPSMVRLTLSHIRLASSCLACSASP